MDRLDQLFARSQREIEAHSPSLTSTETGSYFLDEASGLLAALRLWAQIQYRTDQVVREVLEAANEVLLTGVAREWQETGTPEGRTAGWMIRKMASRPSGELTVVASYALQAL